MKLVPGGVRVNRRSIENVKCWDNSIVVCVHATTKVNTYCATVTE